MTLPMGFPDNLLISPQGNLAVARWLDQGASGWEFVLLKESGDFYLRKRELNLIVKVRCLPDLALAQMGNTRFLALIHRSSRHSLPEKGPIGKSVSKGALKLAA